MKWKREIEIKYHAFADVERSYRVVSGVGVSSVCNVELQYLAGIYVSAGSKHNLIVIVAWACFCLPFLARILIGYVHNWTAAWGTVFIENISKDENGC